MVLVNSNTGSAFLAFFLIAFLPMARLLKCQETQDWSYESAVLRGEGIFTDFSLNKTTVVVGLKDFSQKSINASEELALWLLERHFTMRRLRLRDDEIDEVWSLLLNQSPLKLRFCGSRFISAASSSDKSFLVYVVDDNSVQFDSDYESRLYAWCLQQNDPQILEAAIRLTAPLALPARKQAFERLRSGTLRPPEHCRHIAALRELVAEHQLAVLQYGIAEAKLGNRVEAEQAKAVAQAWSSIPAGAFRTIARSLGLGPSWESGPGRLLHIQEMISGHAGSVLAEAYDVGAEGWLYRAKSALELKSPICALLAARRAIALGKHDAAALAAMACDQLGLPHSAQAYRAWPGLFKDP